MGTERLKGKRWGTRAGSTRHIRVRFAIKQKSKSYCIFSKVLLFCYLQGLVLRRLKCHTGELGDCGQVESGGKGGRWRLVVHRLASRSTSHTRGVKLSAGL
jgi:hypothetical protein